MNRRYGWRPSLPDHRDKQADTTGLTVLDEVDPRAEMPLIFDQGQLGSCTANAVSAAYDYDRYLDSGVYWRPSRLFVYYCERELEGSLGQGDVGAVGRDGFKALQQFGAPAERYWSYYDLDTKYATDPPGSVWARAANNKLQKPYAAVPQNPTSIKQVLSNKQTVAFGFSVYDSFESQQVADTGIVPMPSRRESLLGGHECLVVGYGANLWGNGNDSSAYVLCRNSWGRDWGLQGYFLMPWQYLLDPNLTTDLRTIVRAA